MQGALQPSILFGKRFPNYVGERLQESANGTNTKLDQSTASSRAAENLSGISDAIDRAREI